MDINVENIMEEIRKEIKEKGYSPDMLSFKDVNASYEVERNFNKKEFTNTVGQVEMTKYVPWKHENLGSNAKGTAKKVVQKLVGPIIAPMSDGQNVYNQQVAEAFSQLLGYVSRQEKLLKEYEEKLRYIETRIEKLENK